MSEAENQNLPSVPSDPVENPSETEKGWTTVNFPNAIDVDTIPEAEPEPSQVGLRIRDLEQHNHRLRSRVSELEFALGEAHATLRAETKRFETQISTQQAEAEQRSTRFTHLTQQQATMIAKQRQALNASRQRLQDQEAQIAEQLQTTKTAQTEVNQLAQSLEQAHQAQQKQQILIETLTAQLEASQTQVAQLERDCALTQQRYDDQIQQLRQSENACRDLRSRLHRQQQYTLQFKAALEKCLDVSATQKIEESVDYAISQSESQCESVSFIKAQPVQPWSTTLDQQAWESETVNTFVPPESAWAVAPDDDSLFEEEPETTATEAVEINHETIEHEVIEMAEPELIVVHPPLSYTIARSASEEKPSVHHNIDLFLPNASKSLVVEPSLTVEASEEDEPTVVPEMPTLESLPVEEPTIEEIAANPFSLGLPLMDEPAISSASPFITLSAIDRNLEPIDVLTSETSPSPIVYPQRSQKKRESLAAVELPSFPKPHS
ncbi:hypothetical protein NC981_17250 [Leptolyngbya sp. DQ-M1]|uniref:hypothetical protein n=1 Tax=Leptolyngbya sp. DQ-M1 TaxID=2933920 RepID=UPI003298EA40